MLGKGPAGPLTPQCAALTDSFVDPLTPAHAAPWALILCLQKSLIKPVISSAAKSLWSPQT